MDGTTGSEIDVMTQPAAVLPGAAPTPPATPGGRKYRILFLHPGSIPPNADPQRNLLFHLSRYCEGDIVTTRWDLPEDFEKPRRALTFDTLGDFRYHATRSTRIPGLLRTAWHLVYFFVTGLRLIRSRGGYDVIIAYGPFSLALVGWMLKRLTGTKLIIEVPGPPTEGFTYEPGLSSRVKLRVARWLAPFLLRRADATRLYYAWQLDGLPGGPFPPAYVFPDFVRITENRAEAPPAAAPEASERYVLFLGSPFSRKGVDVLIRAFLSIADRHPGVTLRVVGHCPDRAPYERLAGGDPRVRFSAGIPNEEAMRLMAGCTLFALPSRMEGVPRVLIEAMAAWKPVVSTRASGIPALVEHGRTGLLSDVDDVQGLADNMDRLLGDPGYARRLAEEGHRYVFEELTEERFVERNRAMLESLVGPPAARPGP